MMTQESMKKILQIGVLLSSECDLNQLLDTILMSVMELAGCDAGTLYLLDGETLRFKIMHTNSLGTHSGGDGNDPPLPPVPLRPENVCAYAFLEGRTIRIEDVYTNDKFNFSGPRNYDSITGYRTKSMLVVPMRNREGVKLGVLQLINALDDDGEIQAFPEELVLAVESVASQAALTIQNVNYINDIRELFQSFVRVMSAAVDERSPYNANHSKRMAQVCEKFLEFLNKRADARNEEPPHFLNHKEELVMSVLLHDIGKVTTDLEIMNKPERLYELQKEHICHRMEKIRLLAAIGSLKGEISGAERDHIEQETREFEETIRQTSTAGFVPDERLHWLEQARGRTYLDENGQTNPWLSEDEFSMLSIRRGTLSNEERDHMESHVIVTDKLLSQIKFSADLSHVREWAAAHHEMLNGSGYPKHLTADEIPEEVRIISILDIFDALVAADRPYKRGMPVEQALSILDAMANKEGKLDPKLTALFIESRCWEKIPLGGDFKREKAG